MVINRASKARELVSKHGLSAMLFTDIRNIRYLTGFTGTDGALLVTGDDAVFLTDSRYVEQAGQQVACRLHEYKQKIQGIADFLKKELTSGRIGFESQDVTFAVFSELNDRCGEAFVLEPVPDAARIRAVKDVTELNRIEAAADISRRALESIIDMIRPGRSEIEIATELEIASRRLGSDVKAFDFIVASGPRGAMPHGVASKKRLESGEMVTIDFGSCSQGYFSDETVNFCLGEINPELRVIHDIVLEAHDRAIAFVRPGVPLKEIDRVAREFIAAEGYGDCFGHGLGHGVGLEIHEWPRVSPQADAAAETGMVFTIEPGIYKPGLGGVRIEDIVVVTESGCRCLTSLPKELRVLPI